MAERHAFLGLTCALLGEKERAIAEGNACCRAQAGITRRARRHDMNAVLALIYARTGENARAIELLRHLLAVPGAVDSANYSITLQDLRFRWEWDPIRKDPEFQKLIANKNR